MRDEAPFTPWTCPRCGLEHLAGGSAAREGFCQSLSCIMRRVRSVGPLKPERELSPFLAPFDDFVIPSTPPPGSPEARGPSIDGEALFREAPLATWRGSLGRPERCRCGWKVPQQVVPVHLITGIHVLTEAEMGAGQRPTPPVSVTLLCPECGEPHSYDPMTATGSRGSPEPTGEPS